jgi:predicted CopG family antitoxin
MTKVISISDDAYNKLSNIKGPKESFSEIVITLTEKERILRLKKLSGVWKNDKEIKKRFNIINEDRKNFKMRDLVL